MRLLHAGADPFRCRLHRRRPGDGHSIDHGIDERQSMPLRRLSEHRRGNRRRGARMTTGAFVYRRAVDELDVFARAGDAMVVAGATDLLPLWKTGVIAPGVVIDINALPYDRIESSDAAITVG